MWQLVSCAVQGAGHKKTQTPCQDKTCRLSKNGVHIIALADGAGSAKFSHYGAERVVHDIATYVADNFTAIVNCTDGSIVRNELMEQLLTGIKDEAQKRQCELQDLASTMLLAAVHEDEFFLAHMGDGVIGYMDGDTLKVASYPDNGTFANVTTFVTSKEALVSLRLFKGKLGDKNAFVLMSDGSEQCLYNRQKRMLADAVKKLIIRTSITDNALMCHKLSEVFNSFITRYTQDDCSIAIMARPSAALSINALSLMEQMSLYKLPPESAGSNRITKRYNRILNFVEQPHSLEEIARHIHLKEQQAAQHLDSLIALGLVKKNQEWYQSPGFSTNVEVDKQEDSGRGTGEPVA